MGDKRKNTGDGETPPAKGRPGLKPATVPCPAAAEAPQRPVTAPGPAAVEAAPTPVAVEKPVTAPSPAAVEAAATPVAVETPAAASSAMVLAGGAVAVAAAGGDVMTLLESDVPKTLLFCDECRGHLKPPLYQCSRMLHVACSGCVTSKGKHHELLVAEEDGGVFLLAIEYHEEAEMDLLFLVCVRNKTGAGPVYSSSVVVESPPAVGFSIKVERKVMVSCSVPAEFRKETDRDYFIPVFREMLHGEQSKKLHVCVCISKTQSISE